MHRFASAWHNICWFFSNIAYVKKGNPRNLLYVGSKRHILIKDNSKISYSSSCTLIVHPLQVRKELDRLKQGKAAGPDGISPRLLKSCSTQRCEIFAHLFNLSLQLQRIPTLWKISCLVPVPKKKHPTGPEDYRPIALTSHIMKIFERLVLSHIRPKVSTFTDPFLSLLAYSMEYFVSNGTC